MKRVALLLLSFISVQAYSQENLTTLAKPIVDEGKRLYQSELASWYGTDLFLANYKSQDNIGGYFSYTEGTRTKCIFFSKAEQPKVIGTMSFDSTYNTQSATTDLVEREFTANESILYAIRKQAFEMVYSDTMFKSYKNTNFNLIPLANGDERKVYVLTGTGEQGVVIIGNDYLLTFDKENKLISKKALHQNIIPIYFTNKEEKDLEGTMHSHLPETGDYITATDICTLMLYGKFTKWKQHNVVSKNYLNIWNCQTNQLVVIPMNTIDKINKDQEKKKKK